MGEIATGNWVEGLVLPSWAIVLVAVGGWAGFMALVSKFTKESDFQARLCLFDKRNLRACVRTSIASILCIGGLLSIGTNTSQAQEGARDFHREACDGGDAVGCTNLGVMFSNGDGGPVNKEGARELYRQGCGGGDALGCTYYGWMLTNGKGGAEDKAGAREFYRQGCDGGDPGGL